MKLDVAIAMKISFRKSFSISIILKQHFALFDYDICTLTAYKCVNIKC